MTTRHVELEEQVMSEETNNQPSSPSRRELLHGVGLGVAGSVLAGSMGSTHAQAATFSKSELAGKTAIVTGARANIGRGIAVGLAAMGANILVHYHREETRDQAEETAKRAIAAGAPNTALAAGDLGDPRNAKRMFDVAERDLGPVDILVNNAGLLVKKPIAKVTDADFEKCYNINAKGTFYCMREAANRVRNKGRIINIVTSLAPSLTPNYGAYASSKSANEQLVRTLSKEVGGADRLITVNSIHPGPIDTPFFREPENERSIAYISKLSNEKRLGAIADIVPLVQFLASSGSQWMSGESLYVNGGYAQA